MTATGALAPTCGPRSCGPQGPQLDWWMYVLRCHDNSLYCGISTDVKRRLQEHSEGRGSKYVLSRLPATVVFIEWCGSRSAALKAEAAFKKLRKGKKEEYISF